jgi:MFS transporter, BCD family, chlorophyll transporter
VRDVMLQLSGSLSLAYSSVFMLEIVGLALALFILTRINVKAFQTQAKLDTATMLAAAMD